MELYWGLGIVFFFALLWYFYCRKQSVEEAPLLPTYIVPTPDDSPVMGLKLGPKKLRHIYFVRKGIPNIDLHGMTIFEAKSLTREFIQDQRATDNTVIQIITGRGLHSEDGISKLKPVIKSVLVEENLHFKETNQGGAFLVNLKTI